MAIIGYIIWTANPEIFPTLSWLPVRWYGVLFAFAFILGQQIYFYFAKRDKISDKDVETLTIYMIIGTILGARFGHVFFYEPDRFLANPIEIFMIWKGGLASHGAAAGIITAIFLYSNYYIKIGFTEFTVKRKKREGQSFLFVFDRIVIVAALGGAFIRTGNFINSEIVGKPTSSPMGVVFGRDVIERLEYEDYIDKVQIKRTYTESKKDTAIMPVDIRITFKKANISEEYVNAYLAMQVKKILLNSEYVSMNIAEPPDKPLNFDLSRTTEGTYMANIHTYAIPRYPAQLYEAFTCILLFILLFLIWKRSNKTIADGRIFGIFLIILFVLRFLYEFMKENQVSFEDKLPLNMGQSLSIPFIILGIYLVIRKVEKEG